MIANADNELAPSALFVITPTITANHDNTDIIPTNNMNTIPMSIIWIDGRKPSNIAINTTTTVLMILLMKASKI